MVSLSNNFLSGRTLYSRSAYTWQEDTSGPELYERPSVGGVQDCEINLTGDLL